MKKKMIQIVRWVSTKGLIWLGFGATPFIFMACYGPVPRNYQETTMDEEVVDSNLVDSLNVAEDGAVEAVATEGDGV